MLTELDNKTQTDGGTKIRGVIENSRCVRHVLKRIFRRYRQSCYAVLTSFKLS